MANKLGEVPTGCSRWTEGSKRNKDGLTCTTPKRPTEPRAVVKQPVPCQLGHRCMPKRSHPQTGSAYIYPTLTLPRCSVITDLGSLGFFGPTLRSNRGFSYCMKGFDTECSEAAVTKSKGGVDFAHCGYRLLLEGHLPLPDGGPLKEVHLSRHDWPERALLSSHFLRTHTTPMTVQALHATSSGCRLKFNFSINFQ